MKLKKEKLIIEESKSDLKAFSPIYEEYTKDVFRYVYSLVKNKDKAEEITQDSFLTAMEKLEQFKWTGISIKNWIIKIARNKVYEGSKELKILPENSEYEEIEGLDVSNEHVDYVVQKDLHTVLFDLPVSTREIVILKIWEEYKFSEISDILEINENSVKTQFYRAVTKMRKDLEKKGHNKDTVVLPVIFRGLMDLSLVEELQPSARLIADIEVMSRSIVKSSKISVAKSMRNIFKNMTGKSWLLASGALVVVVTSVIIIGLLAKDNNSVITDNEGKESVDDEKSADSDLSNDSDDDTKSAEDTVESNDDQPVDTKPTLVATNPGWNVYVDPLGRYTFEYPPEYEQFYGPAGVDIPQVDNCYPDSTICLGMEVAPYIEYGGGDISLYKKNTNDTFISSEYSSIDGQVSYKVVSLYTDAGPEYERLIVSYYVVIDNMVYSIFFTEFSEASTPEELIYLDTINKIVQSFEIN